MYVGGVVPVNQLDGNTSWGTDSGGALSYWSLAEGSDMIDAGTENPLYNDRDGTRNDIGPSGGTYYDPEGWTTEKPVVLSFDLSPELTLEGVDSEVTIDTIKSVTATGSAPEFERPQP